jgi:hypothetical protein
MSKSAAEVRTDSVQALKHAHRVLIETTEVAEATNETLAEQGAEE